MAYDLISPKIESFYNKAIFTEENIFSRINTKEIKLSERVQNYNKKHKIKISNEEYAYLVLTQYGESDGALNSIINRLAASIHNEFYKKGFKVNEGVDSVKIEDILIAPKQFSLYDSGNFKEQVQNVIKNDNLLDFVKHGEKYDKTIYDDLIKQNKLFFLPEKERTKYKNEIKLRTNKLWKEINYVERHLAKMITDPNYNPCGDYVVTYHNKKISKAKNTLKHGKEAMWGFDLKEVCDIGGHTMFTLEGKKIGNKQYNFNIWAARNKLKHKYVDNVYKKHTNEPYYSQNTNMSTKNRKCSSN